jgi:hypothetical protein
MTAVGCLVLAVAAGCSRAPIHGAADGAVDGAVDAGASDVAEHDAADAGPVAGNGVPIPPPDLTNTCGHIGAVFAPCTSACAPVSCDCGGSVRKVDLPCLAEGCLTSVSCTGACMLSSDALLTTVLDCLLEGVCTSDQDCSAPKRCLVAPGDTTGECLERGRGARCFQDADCGTSACVAVGTSGRRECDDGTDGASCNFDRHCFRSFRCILLPGEFNGVCSNGNVGEQCFTKADCQPLLDCVAVQGMHVCSAHASGSPCDIDDQCASRVCIASRCASGGAGEPCRDAHDCRVPFCVDGFCSNDSGDAGAD